MALDREAIEARFTAAAGGPDGEDRRAEVRDFLAHAWVDVPALLAENQRLREALEPFAAIAERWKNRPVSGSTVVAQLRDCQRAEEVLK